MEKEIQQLYDNKEFFKAAQKDFEPSNREFASPGSSNLGDITNRSSISIMREEINFLDKEFKDLGLQNSQDRKKESDFLKDSPADSGGSKGSHMSNRNQYCIKNKIKGEFIVSHKVVDTVSPLISLKSSMVNGDGEDLSLNIQNISDIEHDDLKIEMEDTSLKQVFPGKQEKNQLKI